MTNMESFDNTEIETCCHSELCGGCAFQGTAYSEQLRRKNDEVIKLLTDKDIDYGEYLGIEGSPCIERYRNKMEYAFGNMDKGGGMTLGMHRKNNYMSVVTTDQCRLVDEDFNSVLIATLEFCREKGYSFYNKKSHMGFLRHLILRRGVRTNELMVNLVTSSQVGLHREEYVSRLLKLKLNNTIVGIINTINDRLSDCVNCDKLNVLWGRDYYTERIMGLGFKISVFSFFQTNVAAVERLYSEAIAMTDDLSGKAVFDLYCGTGTISQSLAAAAKKVVGIEISGEAIASARENAAYNGIDNCEFIVGDVAAVMEKLRGTPDVIVLDPPRAGVHPKALDKIVQYGAGEILYISCNPKSLVDNLYYLQYYGYRPEKIKAFDNFPFTGHCECVAYLRKEK